MSFEKMRGQPGVMAYLKSALEKNRLPHALLFLGPEGCGQIEAARELAKALFCRDKKGLESCEACAHCRQVDQGSHPDFSVVRPEEGKSVIPVEAIRELIATANLTPFQADFKVFVIECAECLNDVAQNALLKTLEEPPGKTTFILISSTMGGLLPTIRSRAQSLNFSSNFRAGKAEEDVENLKNELLTYILQNLEGRSDAEEPDVSKANRVLIAHAFDGLIEYFREVLLFGAGAGEILADVENRRQKEALSKNWNAEELEEWIELLAETKEKIKNNVNIKLAMAVLWESLRQSYAR